MHQERLLQFSKLEYSKNQSISLNVCMLCKLQKSIRYHVYCHHDITHISHGIIITIVDQLSQQMSIMNNYHTIAQP